MASVSDLFGTKGKNVAEQLVVWAILQQVISTALGPIFEGLAREVNDKLPLTPLSPALLADLVVRAGIDQDSARDYAAQSGIAGKDFDRMVHNAGEAPSLTELIELLRRGLIEHSGRGPDAVTFEQGVAESRLFNKWLPKVEQLGDRPLDPSDAVDGVVEGQISFDDAAQEAFVSGLNRDRFQTLVNIRGRPPDPSQLAEMVRRGFIPLKGTGPQATTFEQGIFEGAQKDKWEPHYEQLIATVPPPRTVTALLRNGTITDDQAQQWFQEAGLTAEAASAYVADAHHVKTTAQRDLTSSLIEQLYHDQFIDHATAESMLQGIRYSKEDADFILEVVDFQLVRESLNQLVSRVHSLYVAHKITRQAAITALDGHRIPPAGRDAMLGNWDDERAANVRTLTAAEYVDAVYYGVDDIGTGVQNLTQLGYSTDDAERLILIRFHGKPPTQGAPAPAPTPAGG